MKKVIFFAVISLFLANLSVSAKPEPKPEPKVEVQSNTIVLKGLVCDNLTKETLAAAVITTNGQKVYSDLDGNFSISNLCNGKCQIKINLISYQEQILDIDTNTTKTLNIFLKQR